MFSQYSKSLPVVMYHFISRYPGLSLSPELFEENCKVMAEHGWRGVSLEEAEAYFLKQKTLPKKTVLLTFDDGYLDNYIYAWPILRKYGFHGVIFAVADSISEASRANHDAQPRPSLQQVWDGQLTERDLANVHNPVSNNAPGYPVRHDSFFTWAEARAMEASGIMAVGGHTLRHASVYTSDNYVGFRQPGPQLTSFPKSGVSGDFWGCPLFERGAELISRAFILNPDLEEAIKKLVPQDEAGAAEFFKTSENLKALTVLVSSFKDRLGRQESAQEQAARIGQIMSDTQELLSTELGHTVKSFCWPWGISGELALKAGREAGFEVFYQVSRGSNVPGCPLHVNRFKAKKAPGKWLLSRSKIYSHPMMGKLYAKSRI